MPSAAADAANAATAAANASLLKHTKRKSDAYALYYVLCHMYVHCESELHMRWRTNNHNLCTWHLFCI